MQGGKDWLQERLDAMKAQVVTVEVNAMTRDSLLENSASIVR